MRVCYLTYAFELVLVHTFVCLPRHLQSASTLLRPELVMELI